MPDQIERDSTTATHRSFRWIEGIERESAHAEFIETAYDITTGVNICLEIIYAANLERAANDDADAGSEAAPAIGVTEADKLMRLTIAAMALLRKEAGNRIDAANEKSKAEKHRC